MTSNVICSPWLKMTVRTREEVFNRSRSSVFSYMSYTVVSWKQKSRKETELKEKTDTEAKFLVADWGIKSNMALGFRPGPPRRVRQPYSYSVPSPHRLLWNSSTGSSSIVQWRKPYAIVDYIPQPGIKIRQTIFEHLIEKRKYTVKKVSDFPVPSWQTLPGMGTKKSVSFFTVYIATYVPDA